MYKNQPKKIHLTDVQCLELSSSEEGSRSLRMPMEFSKSSVHGRLLPRKRLIRRFSDQDVQSCKFQLAASGSAAGRYQSFSSYECPGFQMAAESSLEFESVKNSVYGKSEKEFQEASQLSTNKGEGYELDFQVPFRNEGSQVSQRIDKGFKPASQLMSKVVSSFPRGNFRLPAGDFISAKQVMNPIYHLCDGSIKDETSKSGWLLHRSSQEPARNVGASHTSTQVLPLIQKKTRKNQCQKNKLDRYFTYNPVSSSCPSDSALSLPREPTDCINETYLAAAESNCDQSLLTGTILSQNSPCKSILWSPIKKVLGSDTIYYSPTMNQNKWLVASEKADGSSARKSLWKKESGFQESIPAEKHVWTTSNKKRKLDTQSLTASNVSTSKNKLPLSGKEKFSQQKPDDIPGNKYGLFGCSESELSILGSDTDFEDENAAEKVNYFSYLPEELLENILCRLPFMDLHLNVNRVCTAWNNVISSPKFMPWKKTYHHLLKGDRESIRKMEDLMKTQEMFLLEAYLPSLISCMKQFKPATARSKMDDLLRRHPKYNLAKDLLLERFEDCMMNGQIPNPWCIIAATVVLSESVSDIQQIIHCLLGGQSHCMASELLDGLYNIASYLYMFKSLRLDDVWTGMHYRLYYAIYLYENESVSTIGQLSELKRQHGQQSIYRYSMNDANLRLTHEQMRICNHHINPGEIVKIVAFAGTGKTTTLIQYTRMRPSTKFLLVVYNRSVCDHSKTRFTSNVDCYTGHSLAYRNIGRRYGIAKKLCNNVKVSDVLNLLPKRKGESLYVQAKFVVDTLNAFMASADPFITTAHVPTAIMQEDGRMHSVDHSVQMNLANDAQNIWKQMTDLEDRSIRLPHDGYLKLWQLQKPKITKYDVILIDEAQDITQTVADIFLNQKQPKILVGDPHQQIYSFRGAVNAMNLIMPTHTFYLTQSFRFGPEISFVAAACLELFKKEKQKILVGNGIPGGIRGDQVGQLAIIARTNMQLFCEIVKKCSYSDKNVKIAFAGGIKGYGFDMIEDIYSLMTGKETDSIQHPLVKCFVSGGFPELTRYAQKTSDMELLGKINIVTRFMHTIPSHIHQIRQKCISDPEMADIIFSTAHKSKGLEFDTVLVSDDFLETPEVTDARFVEDEYNLLYVAVTRAKKRLLMSPGLVKVLSRVGEKFIYLVSTRQLEESKTSAVSEENFIHKSATPVAKTAVNTSAVTIVKRKLCLSDGSEISGEVFSPGLVSKDMPSLRRIAGVKFQ